MKKLTATLAFALMGLCAAPAFANVDEGLYDPLPPEGSAFVRFVNVSGESGSKPVTAQGKVYDYLDPKETSAYYALPGETLKVDIGGTAKEFDAEAGKFYTVALEGGQLAVFEDRQSENRAKAQITLYNFSPDADLALKTADGKVEVISPVDADQSDSREINPVKVPLAVYNGDQVVADLGALSLERSQSYSVLMFPDRKAELVKGTTNTTR